MSEEDWTSGLLEGFRSGHVGGTAAEVMFRVHANIVWKDGKPYWDGELSHDWLLPTSGMRRDLHLGAVAQDGLALLAVPPLGLGVIRYVHILRADIVREDEVETQGGVVLAASRADTLLLEAVKEHHLALSAVPPLRLGVIRSRFLVREEEVKAVFSGEVLAARVADTLLREAVTEHSLALLAVPPVGLNWHIRYPSVCRQTTKASQYSMRPVTANRRQTVLLSRGADRGYSTPDTSGAFDSGITGVSPPLSIIAAGHFPSSQSGWREPRRRLIQSSTAPRWSVRE